MGQAAWNVTFKELGRGFSVFQAFGDHTKRHGLATCDGFFAVGAVAHHAGQGWHFGEPPAVVFALQLDGKGHARTVASGQLAN